MEISIINDQICRSRRQIVDITLLFLRIQVTRSSSSVSSQEKHTISQGYLRISDMNSPRNEPDDSYPHAVVIVDGVTWP